MKLRHRLPMLVLLAGVLHAFVLVLVLHRGSADLGHGGEAAYVSPVGHWLRDSVLYAPVAVALLLVATLLARHVTARWARADDGLGAVLLWAGLGSVAYALASVPGTIAHGALFSSTHSEATSVWQAGQQAILTLRYSFALLVAFAMVMGLPWMPPRRKGAPAALSPRTPAATTGDP